MNNLWTKIKAWFSSAGQAIEVAFDRDEQIVLTVLQPLLSAAEAAALADLVTFIKGVLTASPNPGSNTLADWERIVLNGLNGLGGELETVGKSLGSNILQAIIGLILAALPAAV